MQNKPIYLWPFILVYRIIIKIPLMLIHYILLCIFFVVMIVSYAWWKFIKYIAMGFSFPFVIVGRSFKNEGKLNKIKENRKKTLDVKSSPESKPLVKETSPVINAGVVEESKIVNTQDKKIDEEKLSKKELNKREKETRRLEKQKLKEESRQKKLQAKLEKQKLKEEARLKKENKKLELLNKENEKFEEHRKHNELIKNSNINKLKARQSKIEEEKEKQKELIEAGVITENKEENKDKKKVRKKFGDYINDALEAIVSIPKKINKNNSAKESALARNKRNKEEMQREALILDFDGEDAKKSSKKIVYEYTGKDSEGNFIKGYFEAFSKVEVHSFLLSEGFEVYSIKTNGMIQFLHGSQESRGVKFKTKDLIFFLTQLSTYVKAGIPLVESLRILSRQFPQKGYQKVFRAMIYDLTMGDNFSSAMEKQNGAFPKILSNMIKTSEMTGELPEILDDMQVYFEESDKTKKQMITALTYPVIVFVLATAALVFIMVYIVPQFVQIYEGMDNAELPGITIFILNLSNFIQTKWMIIVGVVAAIIFIFTYLFKNVKLFKTFIQWLLMHIPIIGNVIIYNEVTMFTKTFASLLKHNVFITDTMDILNKITNNEIWKMIILDTITNLSKGDKISLAFKGHWAVPIPAYEMVVTGERTGQLPEMMQKVSDYYQELHKNQVGRIKSFVEPILILGLTGAVGVIVLSIVIPMFDMYQQLS